MAHRHRRVVPKALVQAWELAVDHEDPLIALAAARAVRAHLANWESALAGEAVESGATWEMVGDATGVSRQAAWERFHAKAARSGAARVESVYEADVRKLRDQVADLKRRARATRSGAEDVSGED